MWFYSLIFFFVASAHLSSVKEQYEHLPYPPISPELESVLAKAIKEETQTLQSYRISLIDHHLFNGFLQSKLEFRALIAGGGTGELTATLAYQMKHKNIPGVVVHLDISNASISRLASHLELDNIEFIEGSLLDVENITQGKLFDFIECTGVLHHLKDPSEGLRKLNSVLKEDGGMAIMVYGTYGRSGVYEMQKAMRLVLPDEIDIPEKIRLARKYFSLAPYTSTFQSNPRFTKAALEYDNEEFYDTFLHSQDVSFTVPQVIKWVEECGLELVDFFPRVLYNPMNTMRDMRKPENSELREFLSHLTRNQIYEFAELMTGAHSMHSFYAIKKGRTSRSLIELEDSGEQIPCLHDNMLLPFEDKFKGERREVTIHVQLQGISISLELPSISREISLAIDCKSSIYEVFSTLKRNKKTKMQWEEFYEIWKKYYEVMNSTGSLTLRQSLNVLKKDEL